MKTVLKIVGIVVAVLIVVAIAIPFLVNVNSFRPQIESNLSSALGRPVKVGNLSLSILSGSVEADQLSIADDPKFSSAPFIQAKSLQVGVELMPLIFSKQLNVTHLTHRSSGNHFAARPRWSLEFLVSRKSVGATSQSGRKNVQRAGERERGQARPDGRNHLRSDRLPANANPSSMTRSTITMRNFSFTSAFPVTASVGLPGGGSLKIDGTAGPINSTDTSLTPVQAKVTLKKLDLAQSALVDPELGITGSADFDGTLTSDGHIAKANGTLKATSLKLVPKGSPADSARPGGLRRRARPEEGDRKGGAGRRHDRQGAGQTHRHLRYARRNHFDPHQAERTSHAGRRPRRHASRARRGSSHGFEAQGRNAFGGDSTPMVRSTSWSPPAG